MATTSLWHIEGSLNDLINYVENPKKTTAKSESKHDLSNLFDYVTREDKTKEEQFVSGINCLKEIALKQMILTKQQFGKTKGYIAWHGYQSFQPGEVSAEECHKIGVELAKKMWGDRFQVIVTTHLDREHLHNHFCINSVSYLDGKKYNYSKSEIQRLRRTSDEICLAHGLSVIEKPMGKTPRSIYFAEKENAPTKYNLMRSAIDFAIEHGATHSQFLTVLREEGYICEINNRARCWMIRSINERRATRLYRLGENYTNVAIRKRIEAQPQREAYEKYRNLMGTVASKPYRDYYQGFWNQLSIMREVKGLKSYYYRYCYMLGILPPESEHRPLSPELRQALRYIERYSEEVRLVGKYDFETYQNVEQFIEDNDEKILQLEKERNKLHNKVSRAKTAEEKRQYLTQKNALTEQLTAIRKESRTARHILADKDSMERNTKIEERAIESRFRGGRYRTSERIR